MNIIIVGGGKIGRTLTKNLAKEKHDVVIIDEDERVVESLVDECDVNGIVGNGASFDIQTTAGVGKADIFIAVTSSDELNMLSCFLAKKSGAKYTIARVRNPEYSHQLSFMRKDLGLNMIVNPELYTGEEVARMLRFPSALNIETFQKGRLDLVEIKITEESPLKDIAITDIAKKYSTKVLICAVQREGEVFIPKGDFVLAEGDKISITASPDHMTKFFKAMKLFKEKTKTVMIVGGGKIAYHAADKLSEMGMQVKVIEKNEERARLLNQLLPKCTVIYGDGADQRLLQEEGIKDVDAFVSLTDLDEQNIMLSMYANYHRVNKVITKINNTALYKLMDIVGVDSIVSPKEITANIVIGYVRAIQNSVSSGVKTLYRIVNKKVEAIEFAATAEFSGLNVKLKELKLKDNILIAAVIRSGKVLIPGGDDAILDGDSVIIVTTNEFFTNLQDIVKE